MPKKNNEQDWSQFLSPTKGQAIDLKQLEIGDSLTVKFNEFKTVELDNGPGLVSEVSVTGAFDGEGSLWFWGTFGAQNGWHSLAHAAISPSAIEGSTFVLSKVESAKSPAGYAYHWEAL
tara:strand:- start:14038 stop:14394 length:357 start_codon:yes stop_codon:yes gene_type:complete